MTEDTSSPNIFDTHSTKEFFDSEKRRFRYADRKPVDCGQMYVLQGSQANLTQGVEEMNCGKVGSPFVFCLDNKNYQSRILIDLFAFCTKFGLN